MTPGKGRMTAPKHHQHSRQRPELRSPHCRPMGLSATGAGIEGVDPGVVSGGVWSVIPETSPGASIASGAGSCLFVTEQRLGSSLVLNVLSLLSVTLRQHPQAL